MLVKRQSIVLCLIECGETAWQIDGRVQGAMDLPLSDAGRIAVAAQLHRLAGSRASIIFHPADEACAESAAMCASHIGVKTKAVGELADPHLGLLEGLTAQEFSERFPTRFKQWEDDPFSLSPPNGEQMHEAADRLFRAVGKILKHSRSAEIAIVLHEMGLGMLRCWLADQPLRDLRLVLNGGPRIERYVIAREMLGALETAAESQFAQS